jgi:predicted dehydrogenase
VQKRFEYRYAPYFRAMIKTGIIGYGYWGPNIGRNFGQHPEIDITAIADKSPDRRKVAQIAFPSATVTADAADILNNTSIDAVAIVTPVFAHFELAKQALQNGKHVFIEKPFTSTSDQARELIDIAAKAQRIIMVDHTFLFTAAVRKMKEMVTSGALGDLYYYDSQRVNLGLFQHDVNVLWDLATHDISIMQYMVPHLKPVSLNAVGMSHFNTGMEDIAYLTVKYENNFIAHFTANWMSPIKIRHTLMAGSKKMLVWDDMENDHKIKVYDKGVEISEKSEIYNLLVQYRSGDMYSPQVQNLEALKLETQYFVDCISKQQKPFNDGEAGLQVVRILEASDRSIKNGGVEVSLL